MWSGRFIWTKQSHAGYACQSHDSDLKIERSELLTRTTHHTSIPWPAPTPRLRTKSYIETRLFRNLEVNITLALLHLSSVVEGPRPDDVRSCSKHLTFQIWNYWRCSSIFSGVFGAVIVFFYCNRLHSANAYALFWLWYAEFVLISNMQITYIRIANICHMLTENTTTELLCLYI